MGVRRLTGQKTYWHLLSAKRRPTVYEVVSNRLLYYPQLGLSIATPCEGWYAKYQQLSLFHAVDLEEFSDPAQTTYAGYTKSRDEQETLVSGLLDSGAEGMDAGLPQPWLVALERLFAPLRYPCHGLMMAAAYLASMAPGGKVVIAASFQAADEMRRVHVLARRLHHLRHAYPEIGAAAARTWTDDPIWQPLRRVIERTLVVYDWSECFVKLNLSLKPVFDHLFIRMLGAAARRHGDTLSAHLLDSLARDVQWQQEWTRKLIMLVLERTPQSRGTVLDWLNAGRMELPEAIAPLAEFMDGGMDAGAAALLAAKSYLARCGLKVRG